MERLFHRSLRLLVMESLAAPLIGLTFFAMLAVEWRFRAQPLPSVRLWLLKGILGFAFIGFLNGAIPGALVWLFRGHSPLHLASAFGVVPGAIFAVLAADFVNYWIHRSMHRSPWLWRWTHQMHHSAERMDLAGLAFTHPLDAVATIAPIALIIWALGLSPVTAALAGWLQFTSAAFTHINIRTPAWLGYVFSRPEQHGLHHARDVHAYNYAQFPIWDLLFRTFRNPARGEFPAQYGFWDGASSELGAMLVGRDVGQPSRARPSALRLETRSF